MNQNSQTNLTIGILVATVVAAGGTYFAFDYLTGAEKPATAPATAATAEAAAPAATEGATSAEDPISAATEAAIAAVGEGSGGSGSGLSEDDARRIGEEVARQVAAQVAQSIVDQQLSNAGTTASESGLSVEEARRIGEEEGRRAALAELATRTDSGSGGGLSAAEAEQIGLAAGRRAALQVAASTAREVVQNEFGGQVAVAAREPEPSTATPAPVVAEAAQTTAPRARPAVAAKAAPASDALKAWWPAPSGSFGLVYAGQPKGEPAIALLFSGQPGDGALNQSVKVYNDRGELVGGSWEAASNPRLAVLRGLAPGRYTVVVASDLADAQGQTLSQPLHGPVYVI